MKTKNRIRSTKTNQTREREIMYRYFCSPWEARTSAWYLALQVSRGYKIVVLTRAPIAPDVASDIDSRSTGDDDDEEEDISLSLSLTIYLYLYMIWWWSSTSSSLCIQFFIWTYVYKIGNFVRDRVVRVHGRKREGADKKVGGIQVFSFIIILI